MLASRPSLEILSPDSILGAVGRSTVGYLPGAGCVTGRHCGGLGVGGLVMDSGGGGKAAAG